MRIGIAFDLIPDDRDGDGPDDRFEEFDKPETVAAIADAIRGAGHDVVLMGDGREFLIRALDDPPDFVFNIAEGEGTSRSREARVPAVCEMLDIPCSGSDPLTLAAALDKQIAKRLVSPLINMVPHGYSISHDVSEHQAYDAILNIFDSMKKNDLTRDDPARSSDVILKPAFEGSSKGIRGVCLADSPSEATAIFMRLAREYRQPILVEEFIEGDEVTVGVLGNGAEARAIGAMRIMPKRPGDRFVYSLEVKRDWANRVVYEIPARLTDFKLEDLFETALHVYHWLGCRDVARIDFRIQPNKPYFIEANPLPGLNPATSDLVILARGYGIEYDELIRRILGTALERVGLSSRGAKAS